MLLWPARLADTYRGEPGCAHPMLTKTQLSGRSFVLLDGSWQQARKMYRQSNTLQHLPCYELQADDAFPLNTFKLRRNQQAEGFCSAQAIALLLWQLKEKQVARDLLQAYDAFSEHVLASRSNHRPRHIDSLDIDAFDVGQAN